MLPAPSHILLVALRDHPCARMAWMLRGFGSASRQAGADAASSCEQTTSCFHKILTCLAQECLLFTGTNKKIAHASWTCIRTLVEEVNSRM